MLRRTIAISLLVIFVCNTFGYYGIFKIMQYNAKVSMRAVLLHTSPGKYVSEFSVPVANASGIDWETPGKELHRNGNMYDVVKCDTIDNTIHIYCISDTREDQLNTSATLAIQNQTDNAQTPIGKAMNTVLKVFFSLTFIPVQNTSLGSENQAVAHTFVYSTVNPGAYFAEITHPPC